MPKKVLLCRMPFGIDEKWIKAMKLKQLLVGLLILILLLLTFYKGNPAMPAPAIDSLYAKLQSDQMSSSEKLKVLKALTMSYWKVSVDSSIHYGKIALNLAESLQNEEDIADVYHNLGVANFYANSYETSLDFLYKSLEIRDRVGEPYKISTTLNSIGNVLYALNNSSEALSYYNRSLELIRVAKNKKMEASILINLGSLHATIGEDKKAFDFLNQSVQLLEELQDSVGLSSALNNLALVYRNGGELSKSLRSDMKALDINQKLGRLWDIAYISNTLGETYLLMKNYEMAYSYFNQALKISEQLGSKDVLLFSYRSLTKYFSAIGDHSLFDVYFKKYDALKDQIFTTENTRSIAEMQVKYETEHKEKENALQKLQLSKERSLRNSFIFTSVLVLIVVVILFFRYRVKRKLNLELESIVRIRTHDLLINQSKLKEAQRIGKSGSWDWDLVLNKPDWSDELPVILGIFDKELNIVSLLKATHPDDRPALLRIFRKDFDESHNIIFDFRLMHNGKVEKYISVHGELSFDETGQPILVQGTIQDITDRKLAELALRESEELYRKLISASPDAVIETNANGVIVFASQQSKALFRTDETDNLAGTSITDWVVESDRQRIIDDIHALFEGSPERDTQYILQRKDGSTFAGELKTAIIFDADGIARGLITVVRNITDRKLLEQRILRNTIETEERERTRFSEDLHDGLGPLLSTVKIYLELISARIGNPAAQEKYIKMTDELLQESIKSTREIANNLTPNLLNDFGLIEALTVYVEKINQTNTISIELKIDSAFVRLPRQTEVALYRVICELINNTLKHASATKIEITLLRKADSYELKYADNGIGFDVQKMITSRSKGLGLSNIISRVKSVNGHCTFSSEPGRNFITSIQIGLPEENIKNQIN